MGDFDGRMYPFFRKNRNDEKAELVVLIGSCRGFRKMIQKKLEPVENLALKVAVRKGTNVRNFRHGFLKEGR